MGHENKNPKKKFKILIFKYAKLDFCKKNLLVQKKKKKKLLRFDVSRKKRLAEIRRVTATYVRF